jgi:NitT/TauT family transport system substrate-binding protein
VRFDGTDVANMLRRTFVQKALAIATAAFAAIALASCGSEQGGGDGGEAAEAVTPLRMQLSWLPTAQFAGYLVAKDKGFYNETGLDVTVLPGGPNVNNVQQLVSGEADLAVDRVSMLFESRDKGVPIKAIAEFDEESGFWLIGRKSDGINSPQDLVGKRTGLYPGDEFEPRAMLQKMGINPDDVPTFYQGFTMDPWLNREYPVAQVTSWDELQVVYLAGVKPEELTIFKPTDYGVGVLHGALLANESVIEKSPEALKAFVDATKRGWTYAFDNPEEAVDIVMKSQQDGSVELQTAMLDGMRQIMWGGADKAPEGWGTIPMDVYEQTATILEDADYVQHPIDVQTAVDTSIATQ